MAETKEKAVEKTPVKETVKTEAKATVKNVEEKVKAAAKKVADKTAKATKATATKAAAKKPAAKKPAAKAPKTAVVLQYNGKEVLYNDLIKKATQLSKKALKKDPKDVKIYVKPEENMAYYVANNGDAIGSFQI